MYHQAEEIGSAIEERDTIPFVVCPLCGLHRKMHKTGRDALRRKKIGEIKSRAAVYNPGKDTRFDVVNLEKEPFLSIRVASGRSAGLKEIDMLTLEEAINSEYRHEVILLLKQMRKKAKELLTVIDKLIGEEKIQ